MLTHAIDLNKKRVLMRNSFFKRIIKKFITIMKLKNLRFSVANIFYRRRFEIPIFLKYSFLRFAF